MGFSDPSSSISGRSWSPGSASSTSTNDGQAEIVAAVERFRAASFDSGTTLEAARRARPPAYERLARFVEWKLIEMPLPRLQTIGNETLPFLYTIGWSKGIDQKIVTRYQRDGSGPFDNRIMLKAGSRSFSSASRAPRSTPSVSPCASCNRIAASSAASGSPMAGGGGRSSITSFPGHVIPTTGLRTSSSPTKSAMARSESSWRRRRTSLRGQRAPRPEVPRPTATDIARRARWDTHPRRTLNVARAIYLRLPEEARLWLRGNTFVPIDRAALRVSLRAGGSP